MTNICNIFLTRGSDSMIQEIFYVISVFLTFLDKTLSSSAVTMPFIQWHHLIGKKSFSSFQSAPTWGGQPCCLGPLLPPDPADPGAPLPALGGDQVRQAGQEGRPALRGAGHQDQLGQGRGHDQSGQWAHPGQPRVTHGDRGRGLHEWGQRLTKGRGVMTIQQFKQTQKRGQIILPYVLVPWSWYIMNEQSITLKCDNCFFSRRRLISWTTDAELILLFFGLDWQQCCQDSFNCNAIYCRPSELKSLAPETWIYIKNT